MRFFQYHEGEISTNCPAAPLGARHRDQPGAFTHYSYAIRDALAAIALPAVEVHLSDIDAREEFRRISVVRDVCVGARAGRGVNSYLEALDLLAEQRR